MRIALLRRIMLLGGTTLTFISTLPMPWPVRLSWAKWLYWLTVKGTLVFPSIFEFVQAQNVAHGIGKQRGQSLPSILQLQKVLEHLEFLEIPPEELKGVLRSAEATGVSAEALPHVLAKSFFGSEEARRVLRTTSKDAQTW